MSDKNDAENGEEVNPKAEDAAEEVGEGEGEAELNEEETDAEIAAIQRRVKEMEEEAAKIEAMQKSVEKSMKPSDAPASGPDVDSRSVYVGNVDYTTTPEELQELFQSCGTVNRITILCDKFTGHPKGFAYIEFKDSDAVVNAMILNETPFKGRPLKVSPKRTNLPGFQRGGGRAGRQTGRGGPPVRGRGGFRGRGGGFRGGGYDDSYGWGGGGGGYYGRRYRHRRAGGYAPY